MVLHKTQKAFRNRTRSHRWTRQKYDIMSGTRMMIICHLFLKNFEDIHANTANAINHFISNNIQKFI